MHRSAWKSTALCQPPEGPRGISSAGHTAWRFHRGEAAGAVSHPAAEQAHVGSTSPWAPHPLASDFASAQGLLAELKQSMHVRSSCSALGAPRALQSPLRPPKQNSLQGPLIPSGSAEGQSGWAASGWHRPGAALPGAAAITLSCLAIPGRPRGGPWLPSNEKKMQTLLHLGLGAAGDKTCPGFPSKAFG